MTHNQRCSSSEVLDACNRSAAHTLGAAQHWHRCAVHKLLLSAVCSAVLCLPGRRYGANIETIKRVLQHQCLPELVEVPVVPGQESVQSFAEAPAWFRRMHQLQLLEEMEQQQKQQQQPGS
jgi:hypothetical protein